MLALVIEYSKLLLLFVLIVTVVTVSRFESRKQSPLPSGEVTARHRHCHPGTVTYGFPLSRE